MLPFDRVAINRVATTSERPDDIILDLEEAATGRTKLIGKGSFTGIYGATSIPGIALHAEFAQPGDALTAVVKGMKIEGLELSGDDAKIVADLTEPFAKMKVAATFRGLDVKYDTNRALGLGFDLAFDGGAGKVDVTKFGFNAPGGGKLGLEAHLDTNRLALKAGLRFTDFQTGSYVPPALRAMAAGKLVGRLDATADLQRKSARLGPIDLRYTRPKANGLPREVKIGGSASIAPDRIKTDGLTVAVTGATATARGSLNPERQLLDLALQVAASDLAKLLGEMGLPPLATSAHLDAKATGTFENPALAGEAKVAGVSAGKHKLPELVARFALENGVARLDKLSGAVLGGPHRGTRHGEAVGEARQQTAAVADRRHEAGSA